MTDYATLTHDDLPPPVPVDAHPPRPASEWKSRKDYEKEARGRLYWARVRAIDEPVGADLRVGCRGQALLEDLRRAAPETGWRVLPDGDDDLAILRLAGVTRGAAPDSPVAFALDPVSGEPFAAWLTNEDVLAWAWPHAEARRLAEKQDAALPGRWRDEMPPLPPSAPPDEGMLAEIAAELAAERRAGVARQLERMRDRRPFVPKGSGTASAVPLPDEEAF